MTTKIGAVKLPPPRHIGVVVKDIDKAVDYYTSMWGLGPWKRFERLVTQEQLLAEGQYKWPYTLKIAAAEWGPVFLELLQPAKGKSVWSDFLETRGEGLHHLCFDVADWEEVVSQLKKQGAKVIVGARTEVVTWCYFETSPGGLIIEIKKGGSF
jgi:catechol 2,3-dioxygenase-like lactoylglutathione lyase family enzyme